MSNVTTPRRGFRALLGLLMLTLMFAGNLIAPVAPARAQNEKYSAMDRFMACVTGSKQGDLAFLVDESSSLQNNDPQNSRVTAARYLASQLARLAGEAQMKIDVRVDGFSTKFSPGNGWSELNPGTLGNVLSMIDAFSSRNLGEGTDYWLALDGERRVMQEHAKTDAKRCRAVVLITDGALYVGRGPEETSTNRIDRPYDPSNPLDTDAQRDSAAKKAETDICRDGGVADQVRAANIAVLGVGLLSQETNAGTFDLMKRIVTGKNDAGQTCGKRLDPAPGDFVLADNVDQLIMIFDRYRSTDKPIQSDLPICQGGVCPDGSHKLVLDVSISRAEILLSTIVDQAQMWVLAPNGQPVRIPAGEINKDQPLPPNLGKGTYTWYTPRTVMIILERDGTKTWPGLWQFVPVDPAKASQGKTAQSSMVVKGDLVPDVKLPADDEIRTGRKVKVDIGLVNGKKAPVDAKTLAGTATLNVDLVEANGKKTQVAHNLGKDKIGTPVEVDLSNVAPGGYSLLVSLAIVTADWIDAKGQTIKGTPLRPSYILLPLNVLAPPNYPSVADHISFGSSEGPVKADGKLAIKGGGCVWLADNGTLETAPQGVTNAKISSSATSKETCLKVPANGKGELPLTLTTEQPGNGGLSGKFSVMVAPTDGPGEPVKIEVTYNADMHKALNSVNFWLSFLIAAIAGPLIPLVLLYLAKFLLASKFPKDALIPVRIPVTISNGQVLRDGSPLELRHSDTATMISPAARKVSIPGATLLAKMGASPFGAGYAVAEPQIPNAIAVSDYAPDPDLKKRSARLPLAVQNHWLLIHDPAGSPEAAEAILLFGGVMSKSQREKLVKSFISSAPRLLPQLRAATGGMPGGGEGSAGSNLPTGGPSLPGGAPTFPGGPGLMPGSAPSFPNAPSGGPSFPSPTGATPSLPGIPGGAPGFPGAQPTNPASQVTPGSQPSAPSRLAGPSFPGTPAPTPAFPNPQPGPSPQLGFPSGLADSQPPGPTPGLPTNPAFPS